MFSTRNVIKRAAAVTMIAVVAGASSAKADDTKTIYSVAAGVDFTSHFVSYGADVWGGGAHDASPFSAASTIFGYTTVTAAFSDSLAGSLNVWSDLNNNADSSIGDYVQEIDVNVGLTYVINDKFSVSATVGQWLYANDVEGIIDLGLNYNDAGMYDGMGFLREGFSLNPSLLLHYRFDPAGGQNDDSAALVASIKPAFDIDIGAPKYPLTLAVPVSVAAFSDEFQGGTNNFGYATIGVVATVPLAFIPEQYGAWTASAGLSYYYTPDDSVPGNPAENFLVSTFSVNVGF